MDTTNTTPARPGSAAAALCAVAVPATGMLAHDPISAAAALPGEPWPGALAATWCQGPARLLTRGPRRHGRLWLTSCSIAAGPGYAVVELRGLRYGPLYVRSLTVCAVAGLATVQLDASAGGAPLRPGARRTIEGMTLQVGDGHPRTSAPRPAIGITVSVPAHPVLRIAAAHAAPPPAQGAARGAPQTPPADWPAVIPDTPEQEEDPCARSSRPSGSWPRPCVPSSSRSATAR